jgi:hypothetical protein
MLIADRLPRLPPRSGGLQLHAPSNKQSASACLVTRLSDERSELRDRHFELAQSKCGDSHSSNGLFGELYAYP